MSSAIIPLPASSPPFSISPPPHLQVLLSPVLASFSSRLSFGDRMASRSPRFTSWWLSRMKVAHWATFGHLLIPESISLVWGAGVTVVLPRRKGQLYLKYWSERRWEIVTQRRAQSCHWSKRHWTQADRQQVGVFWAGLQNKTATDPCQPVSSIPPTLTLSPETWGEGWISVPGDVGATFPIENFSNSIRKWKALCPTYEIRDSGC